MIDTCPLCGGDMGSPHQIAVCGGCHHEVVAVADISVSATGEFHAPAMLSRARREPRQTRPPPGEVVCTWCGKAQAEVRKLLSQGSAHICNGCVGLCADILAAELGDGWRD